jgi:hypothetical protein
MVSEQPQEPGAIFCCRQSHNKALFIALRAPVHISIPLI